MLYCMVGKAITLKTETLTRSRHQPWNARDSGTVSLNTSPIIDSHKAPGSAGQECTAVGSLPQKEFGIDDTPIDQA